MLHTYYTVIELYIKGTKHGKWDGGRGLEIINNKYHRSVHSTTSNIPDFRDRFKSVFNGFKIITKNDVFVCAGPVHAALWSGTNKNRDVSTGPLARPFARGKENY